MLNQTYSLLNKFYTWEVPDTCQYICH